MNNSVALIKSEFKAFLNLRKVCGPCSAVRDEAGHGGAAASWMAHVDWPEGTVETRFMPLDWRDVIKADFERSWIRTVTDTLKSVYFYARASGYGAVFKSNKAHGLFCIYPVLGLALYFAISLLPPVLMAPAVPGWVRSILPADAPGTISWALLLIGSSLWGAADYVLTRRLECWTYFFGIWRTVGISWPGWRAARIRKLRRGLKNSLS